MIAAFDRGATPEDMCRQYSTLRLEDVYAVIGYFLQNQTEVREYLARREKEAEELRERIECEMDSRGLRDRLLARRTTGK